MDSTDLQIWKGIRVYLWLYQKKKCPDSLHGSIITTFDYDMVFHILKDAIISPISRILDLQPRRVWVFAVVAYTICNDWFHACCLV